jgi:hypothetical protein
VHGTSVDWQKVLGELCVLANNNLLQSAEFQDFDLDARIKNQIKRNEITSGWCVHRERIVLQKNNQNKNYKYSRT